MENLEKLIELIKSKGFQEGAFSQESNIVQFENERIALILKAMHLEVFVVMANGATLKGRWAYNTNIEKNIDVLILMTKSL